MIHMVIQILIVKMAPIIARIVAATAKIPPSIKTVFLPVVYSVCVTILLS